MSWSFGRGENVEQCEREHYADHLDEQRREGCRIEGSIRVNKVVGNFHFAPGKSFSNGMTHVHDLENFFSSEQVYTFSHRIHQLRFGPQLGESVVERIGGVSSTGGVSTLSNNRNNPLDNTEQYTDEQPYNYMYFIKVVSTAFLPLGWEKNAGGRSMLDDTPHELIELGKYGQGAGGSVETNQYSVTSHKRNLFGGNDEHEGHKERLHAKGGIPGVFFVCSAPPSVLPCSNVQMLTDCIVLRHIPHESHQP